MLVSHRTRTRVRVAVAVLGASSLTACATVPVEGALSADRPGFVDLTPTVARGVVQTEGGYTQTHTAGDSYSSIGEGLVRMGYASRAELRIHTNSFARLNSGGVKTVGWEDIRLGTKIRLVNADTVPSAVPAVSVLLASTVPTGPTDFFERGLGCIAQRFVCILP